MDPLMDAWMDRSIHGSMDPSIGRSINRYIYRLIDRPLGGCVIGLMYSPPRPCVIRPPPLPSLLHSSSAP
eukprot:2030428-Pyramimonas_sp.AAC.1